MFSPRRTIAPNSSFGMALSGGGVKLPFAFMPLGAVGGAKLGVTFAGIAA